MEADRKIGWAVQKPIPSFRTQSLRMAAGYPPWNPVAVKCPGFYLGGDSILQPKPFKKAQSCIPSRP